MTKHGKLQFNTSTVRDAVMDQIGVNNYHARVQAIWDEWLRKSHELMPDIQVVVGHGASGAEGVEGGWTRLCEGSVGAQVGLVYQM